MKRLLIMRHAKSSWKDEGQSDHERPLNRRGSQAAPQMGRWLADQHLEPDAIFCSTARRAQDTARLVVDEAGWTAPIRRLEKLYLAGANIYREVLRGHADPADCCLVIGHNPGLEELLAESTEQHEAMPTGAVALVDFDLDQWQALTEQTPGQLIHLWRPKELA